MLGVDLEKTNQLNSFLDPFVQSSISLTSLLMTNKLTVAAKVFSNTLIFLLQKRE